MAQYRAIYKYARISPRKVKYVIDMIKDKELNEALPLLKFSPKRAAGMILKVLNSAIANAMDKDDVNPEELAIEKIYVTPGPMLKRYRAASMGRAVRIRRRTSHIYVFLKTKDEEKVEKEVVGKEV